MPSNISAGWLIGVPNEIFHKNAVEAVIAAPKPPWVDYTPRSVRNYFSNTNAAVPEACRKLVVIPIWNEYRGHFRTALPYWLWLRDRYFLR